MKPFVLEKFTFLLGASVAVEDGEPYSSEFPSVKSMLCSFDTFHGSEYDEAVYWLIFLVHFLGNYEIPLLQHINILQKLKLLVLKLCHLSGFWLAFGNLQIYDLNFL